MSASMDYDFFLSYSSADLEFAQKLYRRVSRFRLNDRRLAVFFAPATIAPGESVPRTLRRALQNSRHLIAVVSYSWVHSEWCQLESEISLWLDPAGSDRRLLPCLLDDVELPPELARLSCLDFRDGDGFEVSLAKLVTSVRFSEKQDGRERESIAARQSVLRAPLLPWVEFGGPVMDFLWPEMIIDPTLLARRNPRPAFHMSSWLAAGRIPGENLFALVGDAGAGKSTLLRTILLSGGNRFPPKRVLMHARELINPTRERVRQVRVTGPEGLLLLVDGVDEAGDENVAALSRNLSRLRNENVVCVLGARTDFLERHYSLKGSLLDGLVDVLELQPWNSSDIRTFADRYGERLRDDTIAQAVRGILDAVPGAHDFLSNPMRLTLVLYLLANGLNPSEQTLSQPYSLYSIFFDEWLRKERQRGTGAKVSSDIRVAHTAVARWLYSNRAERSTADEILDDVQIDVGSMLADSAFTALLNTRSNMDGQIEISGYRHETLGEFLIAADILEGFESGGDALDRALRITVGDDVNRFVRSGMQERSPRRRAVLLRNLSDRYEELMSAGAETGRRRDSTERLREQILYYIGRLPLEEFPAVLRVAFEQEKSPLLRRSAALGAILHGVDDIEAAYLSRLDDAEEDALNRSVQLVYFGDTLADLHTFVDNGQEWTRTRKVIFERLTGQSYRDIRLRWWDLRTLRSFLETRSRDRLTGEETAALEGLVFERHGGEDRVIRLRQELDRIRTLARRRRDLET